MVAGGHVVAPGGACVVARGVCGCSRGHVWLLRVGVHFALGGHVWDTTRYGDTINERAVRILLECILVPRYFCAADRFSVKHSEIKLTCKY